MSMSRSLLPRSVTNGKLFGIEGFIANRFMLPGESRATQLYMQLAESTENGFAVNILKEIADENRKHVGESMKLLQELADEENKYFDPGIIEVVEIIKET